ncbi:MAG: DNA-3-methyladenine glycosylase [Alphaproteobacteria bacterium MarineAlpha5_Bin9]|nr:MAG: DNA-3-methyladenine glycosylase [Alphaproteobacteria bacterium MarineAlpha5_Bin9]|tara:strand:- start:5960 stop:6577 length:618 start_codon:yes stop_codon:yes gene_type:complete
MKPHYWSKGKSYLSKKDKILKKIIEKHSKDNLFINKNYFESILNSIIGQQISVRAASSIKEKFFSLEKIIKPEIVLKINLHRLKKIGLSRQKISYIRNLCIFFLNNKEFIKKINYLNENDIRKNLITIKGIGDWTIDMFLIFSLGKKNILPIKDLGLMKAISINYKINLPINEKKLNFFYKKWEPYNSIATWYLWRSIDPINVNY